MSRPAAIVDCLRVLAPDAAATLLDRALQSKWISLPELSRRIGLRSGQPGVQRLLTLLRGVVGGERSAAERRLTDLLRRAGLTGWLANLQVHDDAGLIGFADIAFEEARVIIEVDGYAFHVTPETFQRDRGRQNRLVGAGWTVLRFTWRDLTDRPDHVVAVIRGAVRAGRGG